ncbi:hypothetical protein SBA7_520014 [Candidatus Sulfotelmatobacter sp. SbA7]|nr:hypothetical protein SBA7_520014 [Candidatus Sulfotelmatobacter sp. SbA7]
MGKEVSAVQAQVPGYKDTSTSKAAVVLPHGLWELLRLLFLARKAVIVSDLGAMGPLPSGKPGPRRSNGTASGRPAGGRCDGGAMHWANRCRRGRALVTVSD